MRSRSQKNDDLDAYFFDVNQPNSSDYDNSGAYMSDDFIHIPDDYDDEAAPDVGKPSAFSFNGIHVSMGQLEVPSGAAASVAEPIINGDVDLPPSHPPPLKKLRLTNGFHGDNLTDDVKPNKSFQRNLQPPLQKLRLKNGFYNDDFIDHAIPNTSSFQRSLQPPLPKLRLTNGLCNDDLSDRGKSNSPFQQNLPSPAVTLTHINNGSASEPAKAADTDYHFLMSLLPYMVDLSPSQKLKVRMKIQKLIFKELYKDDVDNE